MTQESKTITGVGTFNTSMTYDAADRVRTLTYPDGEVVTNGYSDPRGVLNTVSGWSSYVNSSSYNALGQVTQQSYNGWNSSSASWSYRGDNFRLDTTGRALRAVARRSIDAPREGGWRPKAVAH